ncbi:unnamed protein product [Psylliodes chrysocephalus]|uniref:Protein KRI1 homolog n=1 Tax=Psylliodes chrysocephalus TaxID=3402493 RepID=A0A9P0DC81_9CUCU|nr:unnamed protein product [Psylliodes chrysocephala]
MSQIFDGEDSPDENTNFKTNNEYAKTYDVWRKKEELNKLKTKYGDDVLDEEDESSSSSDDEEGVEITQAVEKDFFRTLSCLKNKDPSIYNNSVSFFNDSSQAKVKKKKKEKPVFLKDYERNLILEKGGVLSDDEEEVERPKSPTYNQEQSQIKESFKNALENSDDENEENWGGIFQQRTKTKDEMDKDESDYKKWLSGEKNKLGDEKVETDLKPLKDYWNNPNLDQGEKFLRDYILNKKYLDNDDIDYIPTYEEVIHDSDEDLSNDEEHVDKQEEFEHKYNFRYEEPDQEFIKRYPRTMENSLRKTDDRRKLKRQEVKERKKHEKEEKMQDIKKMQELKRKEIEEKLEKLKEITGNESLGFNDKDIDGDFDPEEHDKKMQALFDDEFYRAPEDDQKPEFPDLDEELEIENWERYTGEGEDYEPNCEDDDFNMDCDYDPSKPNDNDDFNLKGRKKRKRKSKFAKAVSKPKPKFDPADEKFEKYFDEYYKLDCEDIIGDTPCRFKYRKVAPNDFGLTTEEILLANERELNKWCSLKKAVQIRSDDVERYEQLAYKKKGQNINLKKKILPSLFTEIPKEQITQQRTDNDTIRKDNNEEKPINKKIKVETITSNKDSEEKTSLSENNSVIGQVNTTIEKKKHGLSEIQSDLTENNKTAQNITAKTNKTKKKKKKKKPKAKVAENSVGTVNKIEGQQSFVDTKNKKRKRNEGDTANASKKKKFNKEREKKLPISDARLSAYGINPKKFKNKLKYKKVE